MRKFNIIKPLFENYTTIDEPIVRLASNYQLYLIGGTAIDMLCRHYGISNNNRNRSNNDIDFLSFAVNLSRTQEYVEELMYQYGFTKGIDSKYMITAVNNTVKVDVDILIDYDSNNSEYGMTVNGILVMSPCYMVYSKLDRYLNSINEERRKIDIADIETLLKIMDKIGESEFSRLETMIAKNLNGSDMIDVLNRLIEKLL